MPEPIIVNDGLENWTIYPDDNSYLMALKTEPDENGIRHVSTDITEGMHTWWWRQAIDKAEKLVAELNIPWGELALTDLDIADGNMGMLSEKLARSSFYIVQINNRLTRLLAVQIAAKEMLEHALNRNLARESGEGRKPSIEVRKAAAVSRDKRLRNLKIEFIESTAAIKSLEVLKESLETLWKTTSRIISVRLREPIE